MRLDKLLARAVVRVVLENKNGTGFFVAPNYVLTAEHVVRPAIDGDDTIDLILGDKTFQATVVDGGYDREKDFAFLEVSEEHDAWLPCDEPSHKKDLWSRGFPGSGEIRHLTGTAAATEPDVVMHSPQFAAENPEYPKGFSGGPVCDENAVIGIVKKFTGDEGVPKGGNFFACSIAALKGNDVADGILGLTEFAAARESAFGEIVARLEDADALVKELSTALGCGNEATAVASTLTRRSETEMVYPLERVHRAHKTKEDLFEVSGHLKFVIDRTLPLAVDLRPRAAALRKKLAVSATTTTTAATSAYLSILLASVDGRPCALHSGPKGLSAKRRVPVLDDEANIEGKDLFQATLDHIAAELGVDNQPTDVEGAIRALSRLLDADDPPPFLAISPEEAVNHEPALERFRDSLPALPVLILEQNRERAREEAALLFVLNRIYRTATDSGADLR
ncbi:MAG: serine protease [Planctomycetota bacterium]